MPAQRRRPCDLVAAGLLTREESSTGRRQLRVTPPAYASLMTTATPLWGLHSDVYGQELKAGPHAEVRRDHGRLRVPCGRTQESHRRTVRWLRTGVARSLFSQTALWEVGSALTMFAIRNHAEEFRTYLGAPDE